MYHELGPDSAVGADRESQARVRTLHLAEGILIGVRRCSAEQAITELVAAGQEAGLSTYALARGLVAAAAADGPVADPAARVAQHRWGDLLPAGTERFSGPHVPTPTHVA
ncbi:hypothetical protein L2K20_18545 [Mycobacterium sp. MBM]|nr:hypothetical protein [Mycobacterium sp. MBM]